MPASATVAISDLAIELKRQGKPVISLSVGEPDFSPPPEVMEAAHEALREGKVKYTALAGSHELRSAVCDDLLRRKGLKYEPSQVVCCCGAKQAILQAVLALCNPGGDVTAPTPRCDMSRTRPLDATGDEIIVPTPYWPSHLGTAQLRGACAGQCHDVVRDMSRRHPSALWRDGRAARDARRGGVRAAARRSRGGLPRAEDDAARDTSETRPETRPSQAAITPKTRRPSRPTACPSLPQPTPQPGTSLLLPC